MNELGPRIGGSLLDNKINLGSQLARLAGNRPASSINKNSKSSKTSSTKISFIVLLMSIICFVTSWLDNECWGQVKPPEPSSGDKYGCTFGFQGKYCDR